MGWRSVEGRRAVHRTAWVGAVLIGLVQVVVPIAFIAWAVVHAFVGALKTPSPEVGGPAPMGDEVLYALPLRDEGDTLFDSTERRAIVRVSLHDDEAPERIVEVEGDSDAPALLSVGEAVWAIDDDAIAIVEAGAVRRIVLEEPLPMHFWPVLIQGTPAVVTFDRDYDADAHVLALRMFEDDRFVVRRAQPTTLGFEPRRVRAVATGIVLDVFVDGYDAPVHHARWTAGDLAPWTRTSVDLEEWTAVSFAGAPAVFGLDESTETTAIIGWRESAGWRKFMTEPSPSAFRIGAVALDDGRAAVITDAMLDGVAVVEIAADGIVQEHEHASSSVMEEAIGLIAAAHLVPVLLTFLFALLVARSMRIHRATEYTVGPRVARYASLTRRGLAKAIDTALAAAGPLAYLALQLRAGAPALDQSSVLATCLLWSVPVGIGLTVLEGVYGRTPGKKLLGIRVVGLDLRPPGIGPAFVRALVGIVDGFFDFLVGIVAVATSDSWQRIGDRVAKTIVIDDAIVERDEDQGRYQLR